MASSGHATACDQDVERVRAREGVLDLVAAGGALALVLFRRVLAHRAVGSGRSEAGSRSLLVMGCCSSTACPGFAIGSAFASTQAAIGVFVITAIAIQNVPEGTATAAAMRPAGYGRAQQIWGAVLTSVPQVPGALVAWSSAPPPAGGAGITSAAAKRELRRAAFDAFVTPLGPEDLCTLSREIDWILDHAKGATRRVRGHGCPSDAGRPRYLGIVLGRQKLYRRCSRMGKTAVDVSERLVHAIFKEH